MESPSSSPPRLVDYSSSSSSSDEDTEWGGDDESIVNVADRAERFYHFQQSITDQTGGATNERGRFHFDLQPVRDQRSQRMGVTERVYDARLMQTGQFMPPQNLLQALQDALKRALHQVVQNVPDRDRVYFSLGSNRLANNYRSWGMRAGDWCRGGDRVDEILGHLAKMLNSNQNFEMDDTFNVSFVHVMEGPRGMGRGRKRKHTPGRKRYAIFRQDKKCIIRIPRDDSELCCAKAIVTAKAHVDHHPKWRSFRECRPIQAEEAIKLHEEVGVPQGPCGYEELTRFAAAPSLYDYRLLLIDADRQYQVTAFGPMSDKQLILVYHDYHYDAVTSLPAFFNRNHVCAHCFRGYDHEGRHKCTVNKLHCSACLQDGCPDLVKAQRRNQWSTCPCSHCHRLFYGPTCLEKHRTHNYEGKPCTDNKPAVCTTRRKCPHCLILLRTKKEQQDHKCGHFNCPSCKKYVPIASHQCFLQVAPMPQQMREEKKKKRRKRAKHGAAAGMATLRANLSDVEQDSSEEDDGDKEPLHVFYDIEAMQERERHVANLLVAETEHDNRPVRFRGEHCIRDFLEWLETLTEDDTRPLIVLAHNFQGYDGYFIVDQYHQQCQLLQQIRNGAKLLQVTQDRIRFIDSLSFLGMPLSAFPKTFGLTELKKGYFPHKFNIPDHQDYVGPIPAKDYYMPEVMSAEARQKFEEWHDQQKDKVFDFAEELTSYCESDVKLLKEGCLCFKQLFEQHTGFNPFEQMTIASACNRDLRMNRMQPNTIASEPLHGWRRKTNQSRKAFEWLYWTDRQVRHDYWNGLTEDERDGLDLMVRSYPHVEHPLHTPRLEHAKNRGEHRVPYTRYTVDGYDPTSHTVYEFHGCFWHGCQTCFPTRYEALERLLGRTMADMFHLTQKKMQFLRDKGYAVVEMWECQWDKMKAECPDIREYLDSLTALAPPLEPRNAFYGGRTNAVKLYHQAEGEEKIKYYDFTSLYPWVNKRGRYPVGHPEFYNDVDPADLEQYFGVAQCQVLPPRDLYHPVLPYREGSKLTFPLCAACVQEQLTQPLVGKSYACHHGDDERALHGTWCTPELQKAVEKGYKIMHIDELWHFPHSQEGLFQDYVDTWLKIKEEASWRGTEDEKAEYIQRYHDKEGIRLDPQNMKYNPGLRQVAKIMLNSMWGKFGQQSNKTQVKEFVDHVKFHRFLDSDKHDVQYVSVFTEDRVEVHYREHEGDVSVSPYLNIFMACFTTCWARLHLYDALGLLGDRCLYYDTDSVIFVSRPGWPDPPLGDFLGDFKDELEAGDHIVEFVSGGPKNYGYKTHEGKIECKVRGFSLNSEGKAQLNYNIMRANVLTEISDPQSQPRQTQVIKSFHVRRDAKHYHLYTFPDYKQYQLVYTKRVLDPETYLTYPYGYAMSRDSARTVQEDGISTLPLDL